MKITRRQLRQIIKEELSRTLLENRLLAEGAQCWETDAGCPGFDEISRRFRKLESDDAKLAMLQDIDDELIEHFLSKAKTEHWMKKKQQGTAPGAAPDSSQEMAEEYISKWNSETTYPDFSLAIANNVADHRAGEGEHADKHRIEFFDGSVFFVSVSDGSDPPDSNLTYGGVATGEQEPPEGSSSYPGWVIMYAEDRLSTEAKWERWMDYLSKQEDKKE